MNFIKEHCIVTPSLSVFVKPELRKGVLPAMLAEILATRIMVKKSQKLHQDDVPLWKLLDRRQYSLKMVANVSYGYTAAGFSGRMPCSEIADAIVGIARRMLEEARKLIETGPWGAKIIYGDTDSLFVLLEGRSREKAFEIGREIIKAVTDANPFPIELKLEKVYEPCVLFSKKHYSGYKYEKEESEPVLESKGIETIRRDGV